MRSPERRRTVSDAGLERAITLAHEHGLKVFLKPHLDLPAHSRIRPRTAATISAPTIARRGSPRTPPSSATTRRWHSGWGSSSLPWPPSCPRSLDDRAAWLQVIRTVRAQYHGTVLYAADPDEYARVPFWDAVDMIGIDAYWPLSKASTTDVHVLQRSWESIRAELAALSAKYDRKILFTEAGYTSQEGTTTDPSDWTLSKTPNQDRTGRGLSSAAGDLQRPAVVGRASTGGSGTPCRITETTTHQLLPSGQGRRIG